mmetsp:Transcript_23810/g.34778  ORF Transcript_23810/g.34778 Transcript_23810/m.34778 type:complete len:101 (-) Transcript_23810:196-498(-)
MIPNSHDSSKHRKLLNLCNYLPYRAVSLISNGSGPDHLCGGFGVVQEIYICHGLAFRFLYAAVVKLASPLYMCSELLCCVLCSTTVYQQQVHVSTVSNAT